ncbi:SpoVG family protein [Halanaerobium hydrogeniformans]|uniref:SpoVG family protein n=1 Tax=Halanaerobium hydrogeniformans TaxID=656519 RepID=E4RJJ5_HALHG|nr:SpoVG family protein [Halanaerobium hydrogeniformans]ADQ15415.1 SpoVG family protein [Halanaerobium hydrogeniformans]
MKITDVRVFPVEINGSMVQAYATVTFDESLVVRDMRIIEGKNGVFISMPARRKRNGEYLDVCFPISATLRETIEKAVLDKFNEDLVEA